MPSILFVDLHRPDRSPSQRYRYEQYLPYLEAQGFRWEHSYLLDARDDQAFYAPGNYFRKLNILLKQIRIRRKDVRRAHQFDIIFVQREAFSLGSAYFEGQFGKSKAKLVFDFDDALWLQNISKANRALAFLKNPRKIPRIIAASDWVIAGNTYLANYARPINPNVSIIPSTIDTQAYQPRPELQPREGKVCIGWTGSHTTVQHFLTLVPVLRRLQETFGDRVYFKVIGKADVTVEGLQLKAVPWQAATEAEDLGELSIGIMPLPDEEWTRGKCGMKGLQYMGMGIATVMARVGTNQEIIQHGENGFLALSPEEWYEALATLIRQPALREQFGTRGRQTVVERYSVQSQQPVYADLLHRVAQMEK